MEPSPAMCEPTTSMKCEAAIHFGYMRIGDFPRLKLVKFLLA